MQAARARARPVGGGGWLWVAPAVVLFGALYTVPLARIFYLSVADPELSLQHYRYLVGEPVYLRVLGVTFEVGLMVTAACLVIGYPVACLLASLRGRSLQIALVFILLPFWTSVLVRNWAWIALLARTGLVNTLLVKLGLIDAPLPLMFNRTGVVIGMTYVLLPFMILALYAVMHGIEPEYLRASASLGASRLQTFWRVFFPLSLPGVWAGGLLVFIMAIGFFITPALLGGGRVPMVATLIESQIRGVLNWGLGAALACVLLAIVLALLFVFDRFLGLEHLFGGSR
ncbi:MAG: ABC transporter permease [Candidatus Rokubacteria bacterium]|nr:ABC transporter permease [Candidatus Rokubacteria bacterium]